MKKLIKKSKNQLKEKIKNELTGDESIIIRTDSIPNLSLYCLCKRSDISLNDVIFGSL